MSKLGRWLNQPGRIGRWWRAVYDGGYATFKAVVMFCTAPMFRVRRVGRRARVPRGQRIVLCPNHESYLDPAFVQMAVRRRVTFVMTNTFYTWRPMRWYFALVGAIPVDGGRQARRGLRRAIATVKRGHVLGLFPEGRLSRDGRRQTGQRGVAVLARRTGAWIVPVGILGSRNAWPAGAMHPRAAQVRVGFGPPMQWTAPPPDRPMREAELAFAAELMQRIETVIDGLRGPADRVPPPA